MFACAGKYGMIIDKNTITDGVDKIMILSASRRTDIPCFYSDWFMNRLKEGFALYRNPMNHSQICRVSLKPEEIDGIVFWTKDPDPMLDKLERLDTMGYPYYFQFTLTPYDKSIESNLRDKKEILTTFRQLSGRLGKHRVLWRYDPIILNEALTMEFHLNKFDYLCRELAGCTEICTISFVDNYQKLGRRVKEEVIKDITEGHMHQLAASMAETARPYGIELRACCEEVDLSPDGVKAASCIDKGVIERIVGHPVTVRRDKSQRLHCGCMQSVDIGAYNTCRNGCIYCYANHSEASIRENLTRHHSESPFLIESNG